MYGIDLSGKTGLIAGAGNKWSLGWGIARVLSKAGMTLVLSYSREKRRGIERLAEEEEMENVVIPPFACDARDDAEIDELFRFIGESRGTLDCFVHSVGAAPPSALESNYTEVTRKEFEAALDTSAFSFVAMTRQAARLMPSGGSAVTLSFAGSHRVFPSYGVMGTAKATLEHSVKQLAYELGPSNIRVNALSPGAIPTASARGIKGFKDFHDDYKVRAPLGREVTQEEVGKVALFLVSELASGVTGELIHVDAGYHIMGAQVLTSPNGSTEAAKDL